MSKHLKRVRENFPADPPPTVETPTDHPTVTPPGPGPQPQA